jgi:hypothetical protein
MGLSAAMLRHAASVSLCAFAAVVFCSSAVVFAAPAPAATPSFDDAKADFAAGQYQACLAKISRLLSPGISKPDPMTRYDLLMLRGECMMQMKQPMMAADTYDSAYSTMKTQGDVQRAAAAKAMVVLIKASSAGTYKPRAATSNGTDAIDIIAPESRQKAMLAMLDDRVKQLSPDIDKALKGTSLLPIQKLLPAVWDMYCLELAATGDTKQTLTLLQTLGEHARGLIGGELNRLGTRVQQLNDMAREPTLVSGSRATGDSIGYRGLTSPERDELHKIADYLVNIRAVCEEGRRIAMRLGNNGEKWDRLLAECADACDTAQRAYDARY